MQRHHRIRHRWIWIFVLLCAVATVATGLVVRPDSPVRTEAEGR